MTVASDIQEFELEASAYDLPIPTTDGQKADKLQLRFVGVVPLDRTDPEHLSFLEALKLGKEVRLIVRGGVSGKGWSHQPSEDGPATVGFHAAVRISDVELGEPA